VVESEVTPDLDALAEAASRAAQELRHLAAADSRARQEAEEALARYRRLRGDLGRLHRIAGEAQTVADHAATLAQEAFEPTCRERAGAVAIAAALVAATARNRLQALDAEVQALAIREDVARLLAEEREREEAARRQVEQRQREARLQDGIAKAEALARERKFNEARRLLGGLVRGHPNSPSLASCIDRIRRQEWAVKTQRLEEALRRARRLVRREPREAIDLLGSLDLIGMPDALVRQVYGLWLSACRSAGFDSALHYTAAFGRGAVLTPTGDNGLEVVSAIGLPHWRPGRRLSQAALKGAHPLC
jgi:TorA maturation chaperone TorD